jgi:hypothetical protein
MTCLFCSNQNDNSDEHIILNSLNGKLHSKDIICSSCNNFFGSELDKFGKNFFNPILLLLDFKNASGIRVEDIDGDENYILKRLNKIQQIKPLISEFKIGDKTILNVRADKKHAQKLFESHSKKFEKEGKRIISTASRRYEDSSPRKVKVDFIPSKELGVLLNKIALEFCGYNNVVFDEFKELARKVRYLDTSFSNVIYCNLEEEIRLYKSTEISHVIKLFHHNNKLLAYIELLNITCAIVVLSENHESSILNYEYFQDVLTGEKFEEKIELNLVKIDEAIDDSENQVADVSSLVNKLILRKRGRDLLNDINEAITEIKNELEQAYTENLITESEHDELLIEKTAKIIAEISFENPYIIDEWDDVNNNELNYYHSNVRDPDFNKFYEINKEFIGTEIIIENEGTYFVERFEKIPITKQKGILIVKVFVILFNGIDKKYIPYREFGNRLQRIE